MALPCKKYLDLVRECDGFPYPDEEGYIDIVSKLYKFRLQEIWGPTSGNKPQCWVTVGLMLPEIVAKMPWTNKFQVDHVTKTVGIPWQEGAKVDFETRAIAEQVGLARDRDSFEILRKWRDEPYKILGLPHAASGRPEVRMARGASALFGIHTIGVHVLGYTRSEDSNEMMLWIPRRSPNKQTFPGMLDNTVGGGLTAGEDQFECLLREAEEEASLPRAVVRTCACAVGAISYFYIRDERAGGRGEVGLLQPATQILYDLELPKDVKPVPLDGEVDEFLLWTPQQTIQALLEGQFKPNSSLAWIEFFIRHGYITAQNEDDYMEIVTRIHRRVYF
ncbi:NUDIX hydrolase domain-like protein [Xylaria bambusicola]|uniref:NUDIX hydrolase domain-like protein n=1 Tax=Xylaria bambusicola TaxID=326684 RepID=UPI0020087960|nr:NUDIX hydrolase domain-like protein [Xylaria bambusicola]KAI0517016.1 NUDIX hydrolase domain-like protein [Xylaria bambusicola]